MTESGRSRHRFGLDSRFLSDFLRAVVQSEMQSQMQSNAESPTKSEVPESYNPEAIERKWQAAWARLGTNQPNLDGAEHPFYALMMFPYPSAEGLHVGNLFAFTGSDISARYHRLLGKNVFQP